MISAKSKERVCDAEVSSSDQGKYTLSFCVPKQCSGKAHITADGEHIDGSPFDIIVRNYAVVSKPLYSCQNQSSPIHVCVSCHCGDVLVTSASGDVRVYSCYVNPKCTIQGSTIGIRHAYGIVVDEDNEVVYITSSIGNKVVKTTLDGKLISSI